MEAVVAPISHSHDLARNIYTACFKLWRSAWTSPFDQLELQTLCHLQSLKFKNDSRMLLYINQKWFIGDDTFAFVLFRLDRELDGLLTMIADRRKERGNK